MKKLLFDLYWAQPIGTSKYHGGGEYIKAIFKHLVINYNDKINIVVFFNKEAYLDDWIKELIEKYHIDELNVKRFDDICRVINFNDYDIFFTGMPYPYGEIELPHNIKKIATFHGVRIIELPKDVYSYKYCYGIAKIKNLLKMLIRQSYLRKRERKKLVKSMSVFDKVITDSMHSKYSFLVNGLKQNGDDIFVEYIPSKVIESFNLSDCSEELRTYGIEKKFILLICGDRWVKNSYRAVKAIDELMNSGYLKDYQVVITGSYPAKLYNQLNMKEKFVPLGYINTILLETLYSMCEFFVYPTLNEGFGLPPLEAMKYGKTCIISGVCSLPEIYGDSVYYVNPYDEMEIKNRVLMASERKIPIERINNKVKEIQKLQSNGLERLCEHIIHN